MERIPCLQYHRIIEWLGLKKTTMIIQFQPPCYVQGHQGMYALVLHHCLKAWDMTTCLNYFWKMALGS